MGNNYAKAEDWGWKILNGQLIPKTTDMYPAPDNLLKVIACNCSGDCSSLNCGCRRGGYSCTSLCGKCQIKECTNVEILIETEDVDGEIHLHEV